MKFLIHCTDL